MSRGHRELRWHTNSSYSPPSLRVSERNYDVHHVSDKASTDSVSGGTIRHTGSRSTASWLPGSSKRHCTVRKTASPQIVGSLSPQSLSGQQEATSRPPIPFGHTFSDQGSQASTSVYPLVFYNPISDCENLDVSSLDRMTDEEYPNSSSPRPDNDSSSIELKFQKNLAELQVETLEGPSTSSRRGGFRWSSASSNDLGLAGEKYTTAGRIDTDNRMPTKSFVPDQKCGVCKKLLWQRSPWSTRRITRGDFPITGVLACSHVFHAECLEQTTPMSNMHEPPCPLCLNMIGALEEPSPISLQTALRSLRSRGGPIMEDQSNYSDNDKSRENRPLASSKGNIRDARGRQSNKKSTFKGNIRIFFGSKVLGQGGPV